MPHDLETQIDIDASPDRVWRVLTDFAAYPTWNPFIKHIQGELARDARLVVDLEPPGGSKMRFKPRVIELVANERLVWLGRLYVPGLFNGAHRFELQPLPGNRTRLVHGEHFTGMLIPLLRKMIDGKTRDGFEAMNRALKTRAETSR